VANEGQPWKSSSWTCLPNVLVHFLGQLIAHVKYISICVILICLRTEELRIWQGYWDCVLEHPHIKGGTLEAMTHDKEMDTLVLGAIPIDTPAWIQDLLKSLVAI
jgi:hypothetical protein